MANHKSAKKRIRRNGRVTERRRARMSRIRTFATRVEQAVASGDAEKAQVALKELQPELHRGVSRGLLHKNTAARKLSRLSSRIRKMA